MKKLHIGIVLDGNRRFAKKLMKQPWKGHEYGAEKVKSLLKWCKELDVKELTLYCFSLENFKRPKREFNYLMNLFKKEIDELKNNKEIERNQIKIKFIGKKELLDNEIQKAMKGVEEKTKNFRRYTINFAIAYSGRQEIIEAVKKLIKSKKEINEENFRKNLWLSDEPDLIIRTGGEKRTSNFLPWQSTYSEWVFLDKTWPEFTKRDLINSINEFHKRNRRFGE